jgi:hypothetical protein
MRSLAFFSLFFLACAGHGDPPAQSPTSVDRTHIDRADLAVDLPGRWDERPIERGHDLRMGDRQQIIVSLLPPAEGLDIGASAARMAEAQQRGMTSLCKQGAVASTPTPVTTPPRAFRLHVECVEPHVIATFVAAPVEGNVLSYEHYWYDAQAFSPELDRADDVILATLHVRPPAATVCPPGVLEQAAANGGACLEAAVLGRAATEECTRALEGRGWTRDDAAAELIGRQTAKKLVCYHGPR